MHRRLLSALLLVSAASLTPRAQPPAFDVATIKRNVSGSDRMSVRREPGGRITVTNNTLFNIIRNAYGLEGFQILGGPDWIHTDRWDVIAKAPGEANQDVVLEMAKTLLAERFKLVARQETRDLPIFVLTLTRSDGRLGPQLRRSTIDCSAIMAEARARGSAPPRSAGGGPLCGINMTRGRMLTSAANMADIARNLTPVAGRTIVDRTGLMGPFDLELTWTTELPPGAQAADGARSDDGPSLFTAVQEQLGLKLQPERGPVNVLVIDSAQRPTED